MYAFDVSLTLKSKLWLKEGVHFYEAQYGYHFLGFVGC